MCMNKKIVYAIGVGLLSLLSLGNVWGQSIVRQPKLDQWVLKGEYEMLRDTLDRMPKSMTSLYYHARLDLAVGRTMLSDSLLRGLKRHEVNRPAPLLVQALSSAMRFDFDKAQTALAALSKVKIGRDTTFVADINHTRKLLSTLERMSHGMQPIKTVAKMPVSSLSSEMDIARQLSHLGEVSPHKYVSKDGRQCWSVKATPDGGCGFLVQHRLGDGSWDEGEVVRLRGLSTQGQVAYPYLLTDGSTLYFAYKGMETLGGWDVYVSRYDRNKKELLVPQQLSLPFNSCADDKLYALDEESGLIYLLSDRGGEGLTLFALEKGSAPLGDNTSTALYAMSMLEDKGEGTLRSMETLRPRTQMSKDIRRDKRAIILTARGRDIRGVEDLVSEASKGILQGYISELNALEEELAYLTSIRQKWSETTAATVRSEIGDEIITLEARVSERREKVGTLRNALLHSEGMQ